MSYRIWDCIRKKWASSKVYLSQHSKLYRYRGLFRRPQLLQSKDYIVHRNTELYDMDDTPIYEGDIVGITGSDKKGLVYFVASIAAYCMLDYQHQTYDILYRELCEESIYVIGNVFDDPDIYASISK